MDDLLYHYSAIAEKVIDGDTCILSVDLGFGVWLRGVRARLFGIDAPEARGKTRVAGLAAQKFLREAIDGKTFTIKTFFDKREKYGRILVQISVGDKIVNDDLVKNGHARYWKYDVR